MKKDDLITLADLNYAEFMREMARWNAASEIIEQDDLLIIAGADSTPVTNCAIRIGDQARPPADEVMERVRTCFDNRKRDYSLRLRGHQDSDLEELCRSAEMIKISEAPGMSIHEPVPVKRQPAKRLRSGRSRDKAGADDYASVVIDSYRSMKMPVVTGQKIFETAETNDPSLQLCGRRLSGRKAGFRGDDYFLPFHCRYLLGRYGRIGPEEGAGRGLCRYGY